MRCNMNKEINKQINETIQLLNTIEEENAIEYATWTNEKAKIKFNESFPAFPITCNYIYWCNLGINIGSEQNKIRPVLVIKTKRNSPICTILPLTSERMSDTRWYHVDLENYSSTVLIEQLRNISKLRILNPHRSKGKLSKINLNDWNNINSALTRYYTMTQWK